MSDTAWNHKIYCFPHEFCSFGHVAFKKKQSASVIIGDFLKPKLLTLAPPDHNNYAQACLGSTQTPSGTKSEETEEISRASMAPGQVEATRRTETMVIPK